MLGFCVLFTVALGVAVLTARSLESLADEELLAQYNAGDLRAFQCLYERHRKPIYNFILRSVGSPDQAEELMQEVFIRIIQNASGYVKDAKFTTWLYTIARNLCIDAYRRRKHRHSVSLNQPVASRSGDNADTTLENFIEAPGEAQAGVQRVFTQEIGDMLQIALDKLSEPQREIFLLREVSQLSYQEIAELVSISENTAKSRMRYALEHIRRHLEEMGLSAEDVP